MQNTEKYTCFILIKEELFYKIRPFLDENILVVVKQRFRELVYAVRNQVVHCAVLYCEKPDQFEEKRLYQFKQKFPTIPLLSILAERWVGTAHKFGRAGIEKVLHFSNIDHLNEEVYGLIHRYRVKITLKNIGITKLNYSKKLDEALLILERNYLTLMEVKEIADLLEINECTLSREFNKYDLPGPKRILMYLKVHHAAMLLENKGLNRQEVALLAGFSDQRRMQECLARINSHNISRYPKSKNQILSHKG